MTAPQRRRQYVNLDPRSLLELEELKEKHAGVRTTMSATLKRPEAGRIVVFELELGPGNAIQTLSYDDAEFARAAEASEPLPGLGAAGVARARRVTDANGRAEMEVFFSRHAGDTFTVTAYPADAPSDRRVVTFETWRRIYLYPLRLGFDDALSGSAVEDLDIGEALKDLGREAFIDFQVAPTAPVPSPAGIFLPRSEALRHVVQTALEPLKPHASAVKHTRQVACIVVLADRIYDLQPCYTALPFSSGLARFNAHLGGTPYEAPKVWWRWLDGGTWVRLDDRHCAHEGMTLKINVPWGCEWRDESARPPARGPSTPGADVELRADYEVLAAESAGLHVSDFIVVRTREGDPASPRAVLLHELGHVLGLVPEGQPTYYEGRGHQGPHCSTGVSSLAAAEYTGGTCIMFGRAGEQCQGDLCAECKGSLRRLPLRRLES